MVKCLVSRHLHKKLHPKKNILQNKELVSYFFINSVPAENSLSAVCSVDVTDFSTCFPGTLIVTT